MQEKLSEQEKVITLLQAKKQEREAELKQEVSPKLTFDFLSMELKLWFAPTAKRHSSQVFVYLPHWLVSTGAAAGEESAEGQRGTGSGRSSDCNLNPG